jgi:hypothetical protein
MSWRDRFKNGFNSLAVELSPEFRTNGQKPVTTNEPKKRLLMGKG